MPIAVASNYLFSINSALCFKENSKMSWVSKRKQFAVMFDVNSFSQGVYIDTIFYCCKRFKIKHFSKKILFFFSFLLFINCVVCEVKHLNRGTFLVSSASALLQVRNH